MATSKLLSCCTKCQRFKAPPVKNVFFRGLVMADQRCVSFRLPLCKISSVLFCYKSGLTLPQRSSVRHLLSHQKAIKSKIGEVPVEKSDIYIQYLQENTPVGVSVKMELKKWQDYVSPPDPRYLEQKQLEYERMRERKKKRDQ
ncbi:hypothetical protein P5673_016170 [Acropora cervicornis]|uniref:Uncharacterized protein n=1 Tax=Acropora cervicornis TaxID=6130 RepID=A0AAD9QH47_ACRCE|nr:hypothetical protein P5673_016170 [Acropora cervicornis]